MHLDSAADLSACRQLMKGGSKSFFAAPLMLPARLRGPATALYAFCRLADDAIVILEHGRKADIPSVLGPLSQVKRYDYGDTALTLFHLTPKEAQPA